MFEEQIANAIKQLSESGKTNLCEKLKLHESYASWLSEHDRACRKADSCLTVLAMIGDDTVASCFQKRKESPKAWRKLVYARPFDYAREGGWCIEDGKQSLKTFHQSSNSHMTARVMYHPARRMNFVHVATG